MDLSPQTVSEPRTHDSNRYCSFENKKLKDQNKKNQEAEIISFKLLNSRYQVRLLTLHNGVFARNFLVQKNTHFRLVTESFAFT